MKRTFEIQAPFEPQGDQPQAISILAERLAQKKKHNVLLGVTGSGKTFTMAHVIARHAKPTLVVAPNKTLAAQLFTELKEFFPQNAVGFFISYYDYYQPEAYIPGTDTYIAKDSSINEDIDKMRHAATQNLFERRDVIIVASVSCIYGLGSPEGYAKQMVPIEKGMTLERNEFLSKLVNIQYSRNDSQLSRGSFRVRGDVVDVLPSHQSEIAVRVEFFGDEVERVALIDSLTGKVRQDVEKLTIYPNSHYISDRSDTRVLVREILTDLGVRLRELKALGKMVEYQRLEQRTMHDVELIEQLGFCPGIENYSRYLTGNAPGEPPPTLLEYFPDDFLTIIDESHITLSQIRGMFRGDRARKQTLVEYGFRLPSALDNRPLNFDEFLARTSSLVYVSATPAAYELEVAGGISAEQIIRPTGLVDPVIEVRPAKDQVDNLYAELRKVTAHGARVLVTTLTKRMSEDLTAYYKELGIKVAYLHADIDSLQRVELLRDLRKGVFDVLIGINLLREGLDLPEVALVAVMDADKEGFLRSRASLIQTAGRAARNVEGRVIFYGDVVTESMRQAIDETNRRRRIQEDYNIKGGITPQTISKKMAPSLREIYGMVSEQDLHIPTTDKFSLIEKYKIKDTRTLDKLIRKKTQEMTKAAKELDFETAAQLRDVIADLKDLMLNFGDDLG